MLKDIESVKGESYPPEERSGKHGPGGKFYTRKSPAKDPGLHQDECDIHNDIDGEVGIKTLDLLHLLFGPFVFFLFEIFHNYLSIASGFYFVLLLSSIRGFSSPPSSY